MVPKLILVEHLKQFLSEDYRQLKALISNKKIYNNKLYEKFKEEEISVTIERSKWKLFGHILQLPLNSPANESMKYYFKVPEKIKKYSGILRTTLTTSIDKDIKQALKKYHTTALPFKQFISTKGLEDPRMLGQERDVSKYFLNVICSTKDE